MKPSSSESLFTPVIPLSHTHAVQQPRVLVNTLLLCGILSSTLYIAMNIIVPAYFPGYSVVTQTISELSAFDAPSRPLWVALAVFYSLLVIAFAMGVLASARSNTKLRVVGVLLLVYAISGFFWPPMHQREVLAAGRGTMSDTLHIAFAIGTSILMMTMIIFGAFAMQKKGFRIYSLMTLVVLLFFGALTGLGSTDLQKNLPTPFLGIWERILIGAFLLWAIVFAWLLMQGQRQKNS